MFKLTIDSDTLCDMHDDTVKFRY